MNVRNINNLDYIEAFHGNYAAFYNTNGKVGIIDRHGDIVIEPAQFDYAVPNSNGYELHALHSNNHDAITFDANTHNCFKGNFYYHKNTDSYIYSQDGLWGVCNAKFEPIIVPTYKILYQWQNRFLGLKNSKWGIIDQAGQMVVPFIYEDITTLANELEEYDHRAVALNGEYFWIDINGKRISKHTYQYLQPRNSKGYAIMKQNNQLGIIDADENVLCLTEFSQIDDGISNYSRFYWCTPEHIAFYKNGLFGIMDVHGNVLVEPAYARIHWQADDELIKVTAPNGKKGVITAEGKVIVPIEYDKVVRRRQLGVIIVSKNSMYSLLNEKGEKLLSDVYSHIDVAADKGINEISVKKDGECYFVNAKEERINIF